MKLPYYVNLAAALALLSGCTTAKLGVPELFNTQATEMHVKGLNGFTVNQTLSFGPYSTSKIENGWIRTRGGRGQRAGETASEARYQFERTAQGTGYRYSLYGDGLESKILCTERKSSAEHQIDLPLKGLEDLSITSNSTYSFFALISPLISGNDIPWQVVLSRNYDIRNDTAKKFLDMPYVEEIGYATNTIEKINIRTIRTKNLSTKNGRSVRMIAPMPAGYELSIDGGVVAIIDTIANNIWTYNDLDKETKLVLASISTAILLRKIGTESTLG